MVKNDTCMMKDMFGCRYAENNRCYILGSGCCCIRWYQKDDIRTLAKHMIKKILVSSQIPDIIENQIIEKSHIKEV